ncbi:hypothetical protein BH18ACT3_BH18ACT3_10260 [soil metagenome]|jgi:hypothetical protein
MTPATRIASSSNPSVNVVAGRTPSSYASTLTAEL